MAGLNKVLLMGNLTKDPEYKTTPSGVGVTTFSIAVGRRFAKESDEVKADFFNIVAWRNTAEFVKNFFSKGKQIVIVGSLQNRSWTDQNGQKRYITEVIADECYFAGSAGQSESNTAATTAQNKPAATFEEVSDDDDLPW